MTRVQALARFVEGARFQDLSEAVLQQLKIRVLDTLGVAIGALDAYPIRAIRNLTMELGGRPLSTLIGGGRTAPDRAAFFNGALSRYLDFMDSYPRQRRNLSSLRQPRGRPCGSRDARCQRGGFSDRARGRLSGPHPAQRDRVLCLWCSGLMRRRRKRAISAANRRVVK